MPEPQPIIITYETALLNKSVNRIYKNSLCCHACILIPSIYIAIAAFTRNNFFISGVATGVIFAYSLLSIIMYYQYRKSLINIFEIQTTQPTITDQGYTENSQATYAWSDMKVLYRYPDCWHIYLKFHAFLILPLHHFPLEVQTEILEKAQAAGCKIK